MPASSLVLLPCRITRSPFSAERIFTITVADGQEHVGAASLHYCYNRQGLRLSADQPPPEKEIEGMVAARIIRQEGKTAVVSIPDGSVVAVPRRRLTRFPRITQAKAGLAAGQPT